MPSVLVLSRISCSYRNDGNGCNV